MAHFLEEVDVVAGKSGVADLSSKSSEHQRPGSKDASVVESKTMRTSEEEKGTNLDSFLVAQKVVTREIS